MARQWKCPNCGSSALAPDRPRKDDTRRYCLPCSAKTGRLVERVCPALDREREARTERRAARTITRRERDSARVVEQVTVDGLDMIAEAARLWRLLALKECRAWSQRVPDVTIRRSTKAYSSGRCYGRRLVVTAGTSRDHAAEVLLHELTHAALGVSEGHSARFWSALRGAAAQAWPDVDFRFADLPKSRGWSVDRWIGDRLGESRA